MLKKVVISICAGVISGLFGAGGGLILVPALTHIFKMNEKEARGTTILCILPMAVVAGFFYSANGLLDFELGIKCAIGGIIGAYIGSKLLKNLNDRVLKISYIIFLIFISMRYLMQ